MATADIFRIADDTEMTDELLLKYIRQNDAKTNSRYAALQRAYENDYDIFHAEKKAPHKPDNRVAVNLARYIVDTFEGFFLGLPVKISCDDESTAEYINAVDDANDGDDLNAELSQTISIYGRGYRIAYVDSEGEIGSAVLDPMESFGVFNESIKPKMRYFVRTYKDSNKKRHGSISDDTYVRYFTIDGGNIRWEEEQLHGFGAVPAVEFIMNSSRQGIFEAVLPLINTLNKAFSEKANDNEYSSDSYLKVLGAKVDEAAIECLRDNRIINLIGKDASDVIVDFISKPSNDGTQEHLLDRLERMIFTVAMVCNISDDDFATSSGIALKYKMLPMINQAAKKWRKFASGLNQFYKLICQNPVTPLAEDAWQNLRYTHTLNYPANLSDEADIAGKLSGIVSKKTQLSVLSVVDDVDAELERIAVEEAEAAEYVTDYETDRGGDEDD